jgi:LCP family protein required for cell wall assembly
MTEQEQPRKNRGPLLGAILAVALTAGIILSWRAISQEMNRPLGPTLQPIPIMAPSETSTRPQTEAIDDGQGTPIASPTPVYPTDEPSMSCGGPGQMLILVVGADTKTGYGGAHADAIRIVKVDFAADRVSILALPRDIWVPVDHLEDQHISEGRIGTVFHWGGAFLGWDQGPALLAETLYSNFGLTVDQYMTINKRSFAKGINALGGVDVCLPEPVYRWTSDTPFLEEGCNRLSGAEAMWLNRIRVPYSDLQRIDRQNRFLLDLRATVLRPSTLNALPDIVSAFRDGILTDLSKSQIASLLCMIPKVELQDITFFTIDQKLLTPVTLTSGAQVFQPDFDGIRGYMSDFLHDRLGAETQGARSGVTE